MGLSYFRFNWNLKFPTVVECQIKLVVLCNVYIYIYILKREKGRLIQVRWARPIGCFLDRTTGLIIKLYYTTGEIPLA